MSNPEAAAQKPWTAADYRSGEKPMHEYLLENAAQIPDRAAYIFYGKETTWGELGDSVRRMAKFLTERGVRKGDRIGLYMQNCPQYLIAHYAVQMAGAIVTPLNPQYKSAEVEYQLDAAEAKAIVVGRDLYPTVAAVRDRLPALELVITTDYADYLPENPTLPVPAELTQPAPAAEGTVDFVEILRTAEPLQQSVPVDLWQDIALMTFTSGTTGRPKGAMLCYGSALYKTAASFEARGIQSDGVSLSTSPVCHIAGMNFGVYMPVYARATVILLARFDVETVIQAFEKYHVDMWYSIAPMNRAILDYPGVEQRNLRSLRQNLATSFGIPVTEGLADAWEKLTGCRMAEAAYGLSETHTSDTYMPKDRVKYGSCGKPIRGNEIRIVDLETGEDLPRGKSGEIAVRNPAVFKGYWRRPEATAETLRDGWVFTGDVGYFDEDGYLYFTGRVKEMIKCSGYSVFPEDVEALMLMHPGIRQCAAIGVPDPKRGESVKLFAVLKPEYAGKLSEQEVIAWARENMAAYKYPRAVEFIAELPATGSGKVLRRLLKDRPAA